MKLLRMRSRIADEETAPLCLDNVDALTKQFMTIEKEVPTHLVVSVALEKDARVIAGWIAQHRGKERDTAARSFIVVVSSTFEPIDCALGCDA